MLRHPWTGADACPAAERYRQELRGRQEREAQALAGLTGWSIDEIRRKMGTAGTGTPEGKPELRWWERLWRP